MQKAQETVLIPGSRIIPKRRKWQPASVFLPGKFHGQKSLVGYSPWGRKESDMTEWQRTQHKRRRESWERLWHPEAQSYYGPKTSPSIIVLGQQVSSKRTVLWETILHSSALDQYKIFSLNHLNSKKKWKPRHISLHFKSMFKNNIT